MANRRYLARTTDSLQLSIASDFLFDIFDNFKLLDSLDALDSTSDDSRTFQDLNDEQKKLHHFLAINALVRTSSTVATKHNVAARAGVTPAFTSIGQGGCGQIFAQDGKGLVVKVQKNTNESSDLVHEAVVHLQVLSALERYPVSDLHIPDVFEFITFKDCDDWFEAHPQLKKMVVESIGCTMPALVCQRILPLPQPIRELLIDHFCPENLKERARSDPTNEDCLIRPYLGGRKSRRHASDTYVPRYFGLRNFTLTLEDMDNLLMETDKLARILGQTLAVLHWVAHCDARDVEFVLGSTATRQVLRLEDIDHSTGQRLATTRAYTHKGPGLEDFLNYRFRKTQLYLLDFNFVRTITKDEAGVRAAVDGFYANDPYFPRPWATTYRGVQAWQSFVIAYIDQSKIILQNNEEVESLAVSFISQVRQRYHKQ